MFPAYVTVVLGMGWSKKQIRLESCHPFEYVHLDAKPIIWLVFWNMNFMTLHSVGNVIIPTDELICFRGVGIPPTSVIIFMLG